MNYLGSSEPDEKAISALLTAIQEANPGAEVEYTGYQYINHGDLPIEASTEPVMRLDGENLHLSASVSEMLKSTVNRVADKKRTVKFLCQRHEHTVAIASDDTVWILEFGKWVQMNELAFPELPQG